MSLQHTASEPNPPRRSDNPAHFIAPDWIVGQQIGALAYALTQVDVTSLQQDDLREQCIATLVQKLYAFKSFGVNPATLSISALHQLAQQHFQDTLRADLRQQFAHWTKVYEDVVTGRWDVVGTTRPSQINAANLIAHQILYSSARAKAVAGATAAFLSERFSPLAEDARELERLDELLSVVRQVRSPTCNLLEAIDEITQVYAKYTQAGLLVRNALLDKVLGWPLLVFGSKGQLSLGAASLPIAVDLQFDNQNGLEIRADRLNRTNGSIAIGDWEEHLRYATYVGKALWRGKNGNAGAWREKALACSVTYDFRVIEAIMGGTPLRAAFADNSMEVYFAQLVLAKLIGRQAGLSAAITGHIGPQRIAPKKWAQTSESGGRQLTHSFAEAKAVDEAPSIKEEEDAALFQEEQQILDWKFYWADGVRAKKSYVYNTFKYNRLALPIINEWHADDTSGDHAYVETNHCAALSDVADCTQIGGWRQFRYVRCPDVAHVLHRYSKELLSADVDEVNRCLALLSSSRKPILNLPEDLSCEALFAALRHINFVRRLESSFPAPSLSWAVVRAVPQEKDSQFWHQFLRVAEAPDETLMSLPFCPDSETAAEIISGALNSLESEQESRRARAPDLVIVLAAKALDVEAEDRDAVRISRPLAFEPVLEALEREPVRPIPDSRHSSFFGKTRIIVVRSDAVLGAIGPSARTLDSADLETIERLQIFRFGFTQQMASVVLRNSVGGGKLVRNKLTELESRGFLTIGSGWYRIRQLSSLDERPRGRSDIALATGHFFAGLSFAPYLLKWPTPGLNVAEALMLDRVREAVFHFDRAAHFATLSLVRKPERGDVAHIRDQARVAQQRLMRFFDIPSWGLVNSLARDRTNMPRRETYELAQELLFEGRIRGRQPRPTALTIAARAAIQYWRELRQDKEGEVSAAHLFDEVVSFYENALSSARASNLLTQDQTLHCLTHYAAFLRRYGEANRHQELRNQLDNQIVALLDAGVRGYHPAAEWFQMNADDQMDNVSAAQTYNLGMTFVPKFYGNLIKWIGASVLAGHDKNALRAELRNLGVGLLGPAMDWADTSAKYAQRKDHWRRGYVIDRYNVGRSFLAKNFTSALEAYQRSRKE